jgi:CheY-like chemotaxis protein
MESKKDQGLFIKWRERGGPPVKAPIRRGFGSVIIERTVPFELNGSAEVRYVLSGLEVDFFIPQQHLVDAPGLPAGGGFHAAHDRPTASPAPSGSCAQPLDGLRVLLVEDNMLIALEAEDMLKELGAAQVDTASSIDQANRFLAGGRYDFALLDVSVGTGTTFELASELRKIGTPYILASGYGDRLPLDNQPAVPAIVQKPYQTSHLLHAIESAGLSCSQETRQA